MKEISEISESGIQTVASLSSPSGPGTGVPFHWHGPGYSEVIYGRKVGGIWAQNVVINFLYL